MRSEVWNLGRVRWRSLVHAARQFVRGSKLRITVIVGVGVMFWALMFAMFLRIFIFLNQFESIQAILIDYLFAFFFLALFVMMAISNGIICYTSLFRSDETSFLLALPVRLENVFAYKSAESIVFSSWGMVTLVVPMILAYGLVMSVPWYFYPVSFLTAIVFVLLPTELGALGALLVTLIVPRHKKTLLAAGGVIAAIAGIIWMLPVIRGETGNIFTEAGIKSVMDRIAFCQHWALPSRWMSESMIALSRREPNHATFLILMLLSNTLFIGIVVHRVGHYLYGQAWAIDHGTSSSRRRRAFGLVDRVTNVALFFMPRTLRQLILKDVKTFLRDPAQWSQCLLFFGLLALYTLNIPRLGLDAIGPYWHNLVSMLNLSATCLTLSTFTSRFIYPQLSLEGRRMWIVGLMPMRRSTILWGKFLFAALGSLLISGTLIVLSDLMVGIDRFVMLVHCVVVVCVCSGLNGLAVGLGAIYPNLRTDNPSKIVSSFGGTFNLVCSIAFITACLAPISIALHFHAVGDLTGSSFLAAVSVALGLVVTFTVVATFVPMGFGARALRKMEF